MSCFVELFGLSRNIKDLATLLNIEIAVFANGEKSKYFLPTTPKNHKFTQAVKYAININSTDSLLADFDGSGAYFVSIPIIFNNLQCGVIVSGIFSIAQENIIKADNGVKVEPQTINKTVKIICYHGIQLMRRAAKYVEAEGSSIKNNPYYIEHSNGEGNFNNLRQNLYSNSVEYNFVENFWQCSDIVADWLGINHDYPKNYAGICNLIYKDDFMRINKVFLSLKNDFTSNFVNEFRIKRPKDGAIRWLEMRGTVITDTFNQPLKFVGMVYDITLYKENQLRLEKQIDNKNKLLSIIGHDLKNPFNALIGFSEILSRSIAEKRYDDAEEYIEIIKSSASQGYDLLVNVLDYSRCETGRINMCIEKLYINKMVNTIFNLSNAAAIHKNIMLVNQLPDNACFMGDTNMISAVLRNLINNAVKFCNKDGVVRVFSQTIENNVEISISDTGIKISENDIEKILAPDSRFSTAGTFGEQGTGLGLWICKFFLNRHNSNLKITSNDEETIFSFQLAIEN